MGIELGRKLLKLPEVLYIIRCIVICLLFIFDFINKVQIVLLWLPLQTGQEVLEDDAVPLGRCLSSLIATVEDFSD